jgi:hypothetical protein
VFYPSQKWNLDRTGRQAPASLSGCASAPSPTEDQRNDEQYDEDDEQDFGNLRSQTRNTEEAEETGDECNDEKDYCVVQHGLSSS